METSRVATQRWQPKTRAPTHKKKKNRQKSRLWRKIKSFQIMVSPLYVRKQQEFQPISHWSVHTIKNVSHAKERELRDWLTLLRTGTERKRDRLRVRKRDVNAMLVSGRLAKVCLTVARVMFFFELVFYILFFPFFFFCFHPYILPSSASSGNRPTRHTHIHTQREIIVCCRLLGSFPYACISIVGI